MGTNVIVVIRTCQDKPLIRKCKVPDVMLQSRHKTKKIFYTGLILFHRTFFRLRALVFFSRTFFHRQPQSAPTVRSVLPLRAARDGSSRNVVASARCAARATRPLPGCLCSRAERSRRGRGAGSREQAEEGGGFGVPRPDQAVPPAAVKLGVSLPALAPGSCAHSSAWLGLCAVPRNGADKRSIDGELGALPEREAVAYDLGVVDGHINVHGRQSNVATNAGFRLLGKPVRWRSRRELLCRQLPPTWHKRRGGRRTHRVYLGRSRHAGQAEQDPKVGRGDGYILRSTRAESSPACESSSAREAGVRSERCLSSARSSHAWAAVRCHPRRQSLGSSPRGRMSAWPGMASSQIATCTPSLAAACVAASTEGMRPAAGAAVGRGRRVRASRGGLVPRPRPVRHCA